MTGYSREEETDSPVSSIKSNTSVTSSVGKHIIMINTLWVEVLGAWSSSAVCSALYHPFINECHSVQDPQHCGMLDSTCEYLNNIITV